jgi:DNA polymerase-3 subunit chi
LKNSQRALTAIAFHLPAPDKLGYTCRLIRKATLKGAKLMVTGSEPLLRQLDHDLWTFSPTDFVAHCWDDAPQRQQQRSPVILSPLLPGAAVGYAVLINLGPEMPAKFDTFERVIEVVAQDDTDLKHARLRWKQYQAAGFEPAKFDLQAASR